MANDCEDFRSMAEDYAKAWSSHSPEAVASFYASDGQISINKGDVLKGRAAIVEMAAGFFAEFPDLTVHCDAVRKSDTHALFVWMIPLLRSR